MNYRSTHNKKCILYKPAKVIVLYKKDRQNPRVVDTTLIASVDYTTVVSKKYLLVWYSSHNSCVSIASWTHVSYDAIDYSELLIPSTKIPCFLDFIAMIFLKITFICMPCLNRWGIFCSLMEGVNYLSACTE